MKFRRLTNEELAELEKEFVNFLVINTVTAQDWEIMKEANPTQAEEYIEQFSDLVIYKVLKSITYLEHRTEKDLIVFHCLEEAIEMIGVSISGDVDVDFNNEASVASMLLNSSMLDGNVKAFRNTKSYTQDRETEVFEMIQNGCFITDEKLFTTLKTIY